MATITPSQTIGELVRKQPGRARVFEQLHIDYCCGGKRTLEQACESHGVPLANVLELILQEDRSLADLRDLDSMLANAADAMTLSELADHIQATHHAYLRDELPRLDALTEKVSRVHGDKEPRLLTVRQAPLLGTAGSRHASTRA